jgi:hypothetical protein
MDRYERVQHLAELRGLELKLSDGRLGAGHRKWLLVDGAGRIYSRPWSLGDAERQLESD